MPGQSEPLKSNQAKVPSGFAALRQNLRGLRGRMVLYFSLSAFAAAVSLSIVTYASTRAYLLDQRSELATSQAINNAQLLRTLVEVNPQDAGDIVTNIRTESGGYAVI
ncbi:MAG: hypothetical protein ACKOGL_05325 [Acidimicrobiaceae bacterium]